MSKIRIGISACLLGHRVRFDGGHKHDPYLTMTLGQFFDYVPVCPEVECGLGVPREAMRLVGDPNRPRLVTVKTGRDMTDRMEAWARVRLRELEDQGLCGFIFKSKSPSSGMERVKVYGPGGKVRKDGVGIFARMFMEHFPLVPVEDEGRLHDPALRENFIEMVFALQRWREAKASGAGYGRVVEFHTKEKLLIMSHSPSHCRALGKLVAHGKTMPQDQFLAEYERGLVSALRLKATVAKHTNVLLHAMGYFKKALTPSQKAELLELIQWYREGMVPLIVPITMLNHYVRTLGQPYLAVQTYLNPHPLALKLRNHA